MPNSLNSKVKSSISEVKSTVLYYYYYYYNYWLRFVKILKEELRRIISFDAGTCKLAAYSVVRLFINVLKTVSGPRVLIIFGVNILY